MSDEQEQIQVRQIASTCRFYEQKFPAVDSVVMVQITAIQPVGAMAVLPEYAGLSGMVLASEISRRRFRSIKQVITVGKLIPCTVVRVDTVKGYIDLSKKRVAPNDAKQAEDRYARSRHVHSIMSRVAHVTGKDLTELYQSFCWDLYKLFDHAYFAFNAIANNDLSILEKYNISEDVKTTLISIIKQKMSPKPASIFARLDATCFGPTGVFGLKEAFQKGLDCSTEQIPLRIRVVGPPVYVITTTCAVPSQGLAVVKAAIEAINTHLVSIGGKCVCPNGPQMTESDFTLQQLASLADQDKDDDEDDEDEDDDEDDDDYE
jgi:translation initiation factor 2 subunit 1